MKFPMLALNTIKIGAALIAPGTVFDAGSKKEAQILTAGGAAETYTAPLPDPQPASSAPKPPDAELTADEAELLDQINRATTIEDLAAMVGEDEERQTIRDAFSARMEQLSA